VSVSARRLLLAVLWGAGLFLLSPASAFAAEAITLRVGPTTVSYGSPVAFRGAISPAVAGERVGIYAQIGDHWSRLWTATTRGDGTFARPLIVKAPGPFLAEATDAAGDTIVSAPVPVRVRPRVVTALRGSRRTGDALYLVGRVVPRTAGTVTVTEGERVLQATPGRDGTFRVPLTTTGLYRYRAVVRLLPAAGFVAWRRVHTVQVLLPPLAYGARGPAVHALESSLLRLGHYALPGVDSVYDYATADAVLAFQSVHGLPRTGTVDRRFWGALRSAAPPLARIGSGDHIEVDKTRQVMFEVRDGRVASVAHVSTGATGNTPPGHWYVYSKTSGYNAKGMFDSLYFIRGFAIHGYYSVPSYPASHGCVRTPIWFASGFYSRWGVGTSVYVFA
jgi:peptidoglycan hydrolase-like protein with peptidoglycan-binding domain